MSTNHEAGGESLQFFLTGGGEEGAESQLLACTSPASIGQNVNGIGTGTGFSKGSCGGCNNWSEAWETPVLLPWEPSRLGEKSMSYEVPSICDWLLVLPLFPGDVATPHHM